MVSVKIVKIISKWEIMMLRKLLRLLLWSSVSLLPNLPTFTVCQCYIKRRDPLAYLSQSLATFHAEASDGAVLHMVCPTDSQVCLQQSQPPSPWYYQVVMQKVSYSSVMNNQSCAVQEAVRIVEEKCQGNNECFVKVDPDTLVSIFPDPCSGHR